MSCKAPNDMSTTDAYNRIHEFVSKNSNIKEFKIEDDNHGMGMISTLGSQEPKQAVNMRLDQSTIRNYMVQNGFQAISDSICSRK